MDKAVTVRAVNLRLLYIPVGIAGMLAYGLLTGGPKVPMDDYGDLGAGVVKEEKVDTFASEFGGAAVTTKGGIAVKTTELESFSPSDMSLVDAGSRPQIFTISITNGTKKSLDLFNVAITKTDIAGDTQAVCMDLFDDTAGVVGVPFDPLAVGDTVDFKWAMACPGSAGTEISVTLAVTPKEEVAFKGKLA